MDTASDVAGLSWDVGSYPIAIRLETPSRYYLCRVQQDLFGHWELHRMWGAKGSRLGNSMREPADSADHASELLQAVLRLRAQHGYQVVAQIRSTREGGA